LELSQNAFELAKRYNLTKQVQSGLDSVLDFIFFHDGHICNPGLDTSVSSYDSIKEYLLEIREMTDIVVDLTPLLDELIEKFEDAYCSVCIEV
jgi:hypothetical protein